MKNLIIVLALVLVSCSVKQDNTVLQKQQQIANVQEEVANLQKRLTEVTLLHHIYLLESENFRDDRLKSALESVFDDNYNRADSLLQYTKIDAKEALDRL